MGNYWTGDNGDPSVTPGAAGLPPMFSQDEITSGIVSLACIVAVLAIWMVYCKTGKSWDKACEAIGTGLIAIGWGGVAVVFLIVLVNGEWPHYFQPVRIRLKIGADFFGPFWFPVFVALVSGPGVLLQWLGERIRERRLKK